MKDEQTPTVREMEILKILWQRGEATVRDVYEEIRERAPIVQNTVQAFLRTMEQKGLVMHRMQGRAFVYKPRMRRDQTIRRMAGRLLDSVFDGAIDQLVDSLFSHRTPNDEELKRLQELIIGAKDEKQSTTDNRTRQRS